MARLARQRRYIAALLSGLRLAGRRATLVETAISLVVVLDEVTYKFKKAVRLPFVDYLRRGARRRCCEAEVRLNARYASALYLGVSRLTAAGQAIVLDGAGPVLDYAVRMRTFPQAALWSNRLAAGRLGPSDAGELAAVLARFHAAAGVCAPGAPWGTAVAIARRRRADLREIRAALPPSAAATLERVAAWQEAAARRLRRVFACRRAQGAIRECHGDLHCANIVTLDNGPMPFDGIEFNAGLRWTDRMQDVAFAWMDLQCHGRHDLAARLLSDYLAANGDYAGLTVLPYYRVQRAMVRAKVTALGGDVGLAMHYLAFAARCTGPGGGALVLLHGLSGSGKSTLAQALVEPLGAVQVRSDLERKRLFGAGAPALYGPAQTAATYRRLVQAARRALEAGVPVIVDAASLQRWQRQLFAGLARARRVPFLIVQVTASAPVLDARLRQRAACGADPSDADAAVLAWQMKTMQALASDELADVLTIASDGVVGAGVGATVLSALAAKGWPGADPMAGSVHPASSTFATDGPDCR